MESSRQPNTMSYNGHLPPNPRASVGEIDQYQTAYDEMTYGTTVPYQTEISQQQQFITYPDHQMLINQQPIGGNNYGGNNTVNLFPQSPDESLYFQRQKELEEEKLRLERIQELNYAKANGINASVHQALLEMDREDQIRRVFDEQRPTATVDVKSLCMKRVNAYIKYQKYRPKDNNFEYWRRFVAEFFNPDAKKRWCVSSYKEAQRATTPQLTQGASECKLCIREPGKGFVAKYEILPRLFKIKYESGIIEDVFHLHEPEGRRYTTSGKLTLIYDEAVQHTFYEKLHVVRKGKLRVDFNRNLKMLSFEFCSEVHQQYISTTLVREINAAAERYNKSEKTATDLRSTCSMLAEFARRLAKLTDEAPILDEYGYNKRYVMSLMITGILEGMGTTMELSYATRIGPIENHAVVNDGPRTAENADGEICVAELLE